jgi:hypothetical protein
MNPRALLLGTLFSLISFFSLVKIAAGQANSGTVSSGAASPEEVALLREKAEAGDARAQSLLGLDYMTGNGVAQDFKEAVRWYLAASVKGSADAQFGLGFLYEQGRVFPETTSRRWPTTQLRPGRDMRSRRTTWVPCTSTDAGLPGIRTKRPVGTAPPLNTTTQWDSLIWRLCISLEMGSHKTIQRQPDGSVRLPIKDSLPHRTISPHCTTVAPEFPGTTSKRQNGRSEPRSRAMPARKPTWVSSMNKAEECPSTTLAPTCGTNLPQPEGTNAAAPG